MEFEGSMYIFVFNWTPAVSAVDVSTPPFGSRPAPAPRHPRAPRAAPRRPRRPAPSRDAPPAHCILAQLALASDSSVGSGHTIEAT